MKIFCNHDWEIIQKTVSPQFTNIPSCSEYMAERMLLGITTVYLKCKKCSKLQLQEMLGTPKDS